MEFQLSYFKFWKMMLCKCWTQYTSKFGRLSSGHRRSVFILIPKKSESEVAQLCLTLCDPMDCSLQGSSVHGIFQAILLEWIAISFSRGSSQPRDRTWVFCIVDRRFTVWATRKVLTTSARSLLPNNVTSWGSGWMYLLGATWESLGLQVPRTPTSLF